MNNGKYKALLIVLKAAFGLMLFSVLFINPNISAEPYKSAKNKSQTRHAANRIFVRFKPGTNSNLVGNLLNKAKGAKNKAKGKAIKSQDRSFKSIEGLKLVNLPPGRDIETAMAQLRSNPNVLYVEPDYEYRLNNTPNDSSFNQLWALQNTGQSIWGQAGIADVDINAPEAWNTTTGSTEVYVAVLDSGVNYSHPDLIDNMWVNTGEIAANGIDDDANGYVDDVYGINAYAAVYGGPVSDPMDDNSHGSHVAGTISAVGNNGIGVSGVSQSTKIIACKIGNSAGQIFVSAAVICMDYVYNLKTQKGLNIVATNNSWGGGSYSTSMYNAIETHLNAGILFVAAAGNDSNNNDVTRGYPSGYFIPNVIAVAATDNRDNQASFSNYGRRSVHLGAPGVGIYSTDLGTSYTFKQGTSMATPQVSGLIALLAAENTAREWKTLKNLTIAGGKDITALDSTTVSGRRIRAWDTDGSGSMTCSNQTVSSTIYPVANSTAIALGGTQGLAMLNIDCDTPNGSLTVTGSGPSAVSDIYLLDDGQGFDKIANDGIYSANWSAPEIAGTYTLTFPDNQTLSVAVDSTLKPYRQPQTIAYSYRDVSGLSYQSIADNTYLQYGVPFVIKFAGHSGYGSVYITPKGTISFHSPSSSGLNDTIPSSAFTTLVAPFWDDLNMASGQFRYGYSSTELILDWLVPHKNNNGTVQFQVVFTKDSSDVIVNYKDVAFGDASYDYGASASVGLQIASSSGTQFSKNSVSLSNNTAYLWQIDTGAPSADAGTDQNVNGNDLVSLTGSGTDPDNGTLSYRWTQVSGSSVNLSQANTATASFTTPNTTETLAFLLTVTDDAGRTATDSVNVAVTAGSIVTGSIGFKASVFSANEGDGIATITLKRENGSAGEASVTYATTTGGTATVATDYSATSGVITWADGESGTKSFSISILDDASYESTESIKILLSNPSTGLTINNNQVDLMLIDNDSILDFKQTSYSILENSGSAVIDVRRSGSSEGSVSVNYTTNSGTATAGNDFTASSGILSWADGELGAKSFTITILDDSIVESDETVDIQLSNANGASIGSANTNLIIIDTESELSFKDAAYLTYENSGTASIYVKRTGSSSGTASVDYTTLGGGTATATSDFTSTSGTLTWNDGETGAKSFSVSIIDDASYEETEHLNLQLSNVSGASLLESTTTLYIVDTESNISFKQDIYAVNENDGTATINIKRSGSAAGIASVDYAIISGGTATASSDYITTSGTLTWMDGEIGAKSFTITILDDSSSESDETISLELSNASGATISTSTASLLILDTESSIGFKDSAFIVNENNSTASIFLKRFGSSNGVVSVDYATTLAGTSNAGTDYSTTTGTLSWNSGESGAKTFTIPIIDDSDFEFTETVAIQLYNPVNATLNSSDTYLYIFDDDATIGFKDAAYNVNESDGIVTITVRRTGSTAGAVSVNYANVTGGSAIAGTDYTATSGTLNWADGDNAHKSFTIPIIADSSFESVETIAIELSGVSGAGLGTASATIYINDDDSKVGFKDAYYAVDESAGTATIKVRRSGSSSGAVSVNYATITGGTATDGSDYTSTSGTLNWADGEVGVKTFTLLLSNDTNYEANETVALQLSAATGASLDTSDIYLYIVNDDATVGFKDAAYSVDESASNVTITVRRRGSINGAISVDYATVAGGTATSGVDYTSVSGTLNWADGDNAHKTFTIPIINDGSTETYETISLQLSNVAGAEISVNNISVYILDND